ncbi:MAG: nucleotide exchange factor GrpE [Oceanospirillaceae bacterium]|nr:nucleotide exchange factor GrpE [Oceanospirillaceae bacterium]
MSDQQDKPADVNDVENAKVVEDVEVLDGEVVEETTLEPVEAVEAELVSDEQDPLAGLDMIKQLATAQEEIASLKDQMLRTVADSQNTKRRAEQDVTKARKFGTEKFANEMLPIVDSLAMALQSNADNEAAKTVNEGVEMTLSMLLSALEKFNVVAVDPQGEVFNPELHQAMSMVDGGEAASNTVIAVMQKGFTISGRLLRPAMVMVAK